MPSSAGIPSLLLEQLRGCFSDLLRGGGGGCKLQRRDRLGTHAGIATPVWRPLCTVWTLRRAHLAAFPAQLPPPTLFTRLSQPHHTPLLLPPTDRRNRATSPRDMTAREADTFRAACDAVLTEVY